MHQTNNIRIRNLHSRTPCTPIPNTRTPSTPVPNTRIFICPRSGCNREFRNAAMLKRHIRHDVHPTAQSTATTTGNTRAISPNNSLFNARAYLEASSSPIRQPRQHTLIYDDSDSSSDTSVANTTSGFNQVDPQTPSHHSSLLSSPRGFSQCASDDSVFNLRTDSPTQSAPFGHPWNITNEMEDKEMEDKEMEDDGGRGELANSEDDLFDASDRPQPSEAVKVTQVFHPLISGEPCNTYGNFVPLDAPPPPRESPPAKDDWTPYESRAEFEAADLLYTRIQMSSGNINNLLDIWAATLAVHHDSPPFSSHSQLYSTIDSTPLGDVAWENFTLKYNGEWPASNAPQWMSDEYPVWFRDPRQLVQNILSNPDMDGEIDYAPFQEHDTKGNHRFQDLMSGNWAWKQANIIAEDPATHGSMFVLLILGSDKTTVSVATGQNDYWPVYLSIGNIHNSVRRAHRNGVCLLGFLAIPKTYLSSVDLDAKGWRELLSSLSWPILSTSTQPLTSKPRSLISSPTVKPANATPYLSSADLNAKGAGVALESVMADFIHLDVAVDVEATESDFLPSVKLVNSGAFCWPRREGVVGVVLESVMADFIHLSAAANVKAAEFDFLLTVKVVDSDMLPVAPLSLSLLPSPLISALPLAVSI